MFRRRSEPPVPEVPAWRRRATEAIELTRRHAGDLLDGGLTSVEVALEQAVADEERVRAAAAALDPDRAGRALKDALRRRQEQPGSVDDGQILALRRRYESVHRLLDRAEALGRQVESTLADLESLAARAVEVALVHGTGRTSELSTELARLHENLAALDAAHRDVAQL